MSSVLRPLGLVVSISLLSAGAAMAAGGKQVADADMHQAASNAMTVQLPSAANANVPGATGRTIVIGNHSTIADDTEATEMQRTGAYVPSD
jgi:hypothetical protein